MIRFILLASTYFISNTVFSQDVIIEQAGDSIQCYITNVKRDSIYYKYWDFDEIKDGALLLTTVKKFEYYFYEDYRIIVEEKVDSSKVRVVISFGPGLSFRLGKLDPAISKASEQEYRSGFNFTGKAGVLIADVFGVGVKYNQHSTKSSVLGLQSTVKIKYFGPYLLLQTKPINHIMSFSGSLGVGKLSYKENLKSSAFIGYSSQEFNFEGSTVGVNVGASYNLIFSKNANFSIDLNLISGKIEDGELKDKNGTFVSSVPEENASTFSLGFSLHLLL